ncbi:unnamed protein product [Natator depressus]
MLQLLLSTTVLTPPSPSKQPVNPQFLLCDHPGSDSTALTRVCSPIKTSGAIHRNERCRVVPCMHRSTSVVPSPSFPLPLPEREASGCSWPDCKVNTLKRCKPHDWHCRACRIPASIPIKPICAVWCDELGPSFLKFSTELYQ